MSYFEVLFAVNLGWFCLGALAFVKVVLWKRNLEALPEKIQETLTSEKFESSHIYLSIIIPMYNEQERLPIMLEDCQKTIMNSSLREKNLEFILVDDGSTDETAKVAFSFSQRSNYAVRYVKLLENTGKGAAVKHGALLAAGEFVLFADADGATPFKEILNFLQIAEAQQAKGNLNFVLYGSRCCKKRKIIRILFSKALSVVKSQILSIHAEDTQCGFKLFSRQAADEIFKRIHLKRWGFDLEIFQICRLNQISLIKINVAWKEISGSKVNLLKDSVAMFLDILMIKLCDSINIWKM